MQIYHAILAGKDIGKVTKYNQLSQEAGSTFAGLFRYMGEALKMGGKAFRRGELILEGKEGMSKIDTGELIKLQVQVHLDK